MSSLASVVIPVFNGERFFGKTLQSVLRQTYPNTEIICVDDGSGDGTPELLRQAAAQHSNVVLSRQGNGGVAAARNRGIALARGEFVSFIDADDLWHPEKLASEIEALEREGPAFGVAYSLFRRIDLEDRVVGRTLGDPSWQGDVTATLMTRNIVGNCSAFTVRKRDLDRTPGFDPSLRERDAEGCEDWKLLCQLARISKFVCVPRYLVGYRRHTKAMSRNVHSMKRSSELMFEDLKREGMTIPRPSESKRRGLQGYWWLREATFGGTFTARSLPGLLLALQNPHSAKLALRWLLRLAVRRARRRFGDPKRGLSFGRMSPEDDAPAWAVRPRGRRPSAAARLQP
jgi:glycosyltransferase involved in cell wall biosynthesis